jgi:hypothetical protein
MPSAMPLTSGKLGPGRIRPVEGETLTTPAPPSAAVAGRVAGGETARAKATTLAAKMLAQATAPRAKKADNKIQ